MLCVRLIMPQHSNLLYFLRQCKSRRHGDGNVMKVLPNQYIDGRYVAFGVLGDLFKQKTTTTYWNKCLAFKPILL